MQSSFFIEAKVEHKISKMGQTEKYNKRKGV